MKLPNGIERGNRPVIGVDWNRTEVQVYDPRTGTTAQFRNLEDVAAAYPGTFLVLESSSESFELQRRALVLAEFAKKDIVAYCYKTQFTAKFRRRHGIDKSDKNDAKVIYRIATETKLSLHVFGPLVERGDGLRKIIASSLIEDRYLHNNAVTISTLAELKDPVPEEFDSILYAEKKLKRSSRARKFRAPIGRFVAVALEVRKAGRGYREFRRQLGNYSNGYASMPRSEFYSGLVRHISNARLGKIKVADMNEAQRGAHRKVMRDVTQAVKWIWLQVRGVGTTVPASNGRLDTPYAEISGSSS